MDIMLVLTLIGVVVAIIAAIAQVLQLRQGPQPVHQQPVEPAASPLPGRSPTVAIPNNLPSPGEFIGRQAEKSRIKEALASRGTLICIDGLGGIGKTMLALEVAAECLQYSQDQEAGSNPLVFGGIIWTSAKDRALTLGDVLDTIARTLTYPGITQQPLEEKRESIRTLLQAKRCLLIVDNFETIIDQTVHDFLAAVPEPTKVLITSRTRDLRAAWSVSLTGMDQLEALALMRTEGHRLGLVSVETAPDQDLIRLYQSTEGSPLAMKWGIGQIKQKGQSLDTVLNYLREARGDVFEIMFTRSWDLLSFETRHVLLVMPFFAASASQEAVEVASDVHGWDLDDALGRLVELWLIEAGDGIDEGAHRYDIHPLTRSFCQKRLTESGPWVEAAQLRVVRYFIDCVQHNGGWNNRNGFAWFEQELPNLLASLDWVFSHGFWLAFIDLFRPMTYFLGTKGYWSERIEYCQKAIISARSLGNVSEEAGLHLNVAWVFSNQGRLDEAESHVRAAQDLILASEDETELWLALAMLVRIAVLRGQFDQAEQLGHRALDAAQRSNTKQAVYVVSSSLGLIALNREDYVEAERIFAAALSGFISLNDEEHVSSRHIDLGHTTRLQGRYDEARDHYQTGLLLGRKVGRQDNIGNALLGLARVEQQEGNAQKALTMATSANDIFARLAMQRELNQTQALIRELENQIVEQPQYSVAT